VKFSGGIAAAVFASVLMADVVCAGDIASLQPIGFSPDGGVFAFEEYGVQDGSGFPYSNIFFIDTRKDTYLPGTPIRVRIDDEQAGLAEVRAQTQVKAAALVDRYDMTNHPGLMAALNPVTETEAPAHRLVYRQYAVEPPVGGIFTLALKEITLPPSALCKDMSPQSIGFNLAFESEDGQPSDRVLHTDTAVPESRKCPTGYRIGGVMVHHTVGRDPVHIVLVQVLSFGFEGRDGRWIAVPAPVVP